MPSTGSLGIKRLTMVMPSVRAPTRRHIADGGTIVSVVLFSALAISCLIPLALHFRINSVVTTGGARRKLGVPCLFNDNGSMFMTAGRKQFVPPTCASVASAAAAPVVIVHQTTEDLDMLKEAEFPKVSVSAKQPSDQLPLHRRELTFEDLVIGEYIDSGSINVVCEVRLPEWWHRGQSGFGEREAILHDRTGQKYVLKIATSPQEGAREIEILERLNSDPIASSQHNIVPLIHGMKDVTSPFHADHEGGHPRDLPDSFPPHVIEELRETPIIAALVVPYLEETHINDLEEKLQGPYGVQRFMRSLISTLAYAHSLGVNNYDLSNSNVFFDEEGDAIIADWNAGHVQNHDIYDEEANFFIVPPEAMLEHVNGQMVKQMSVGAFDVWSAGVMFADLIFRPCFWMSPMHFNMREEYPIRHDYLRETLLAVGGRTVILVSHDVGEVDIAQFVGLNKTELGGRILVPPLYQGDERQRPRVECNLTKFPVLDADDEELRGQAISLLREMMKISPQDCPDCATLLQHPFLNFEN